MSNPGGSPKPVVFLAFADSVEAHLPRLGDELRRLRAALAPTANHGWCQVVERTNVSLDDIIQLFQEYRNQVVLFHYAGHATSHQLLLNASDGSLSKVNAGGFAEFLSHQRNLQLVFLNGCSSAGQVDALLDAGVGAVIATADDILDDVAVEFAGYFYQSFAAGQPLQTAYNEAVAVMRASYGEAIAANPPWQLRIRPELNHLRQWNLANGEEKPRQASDSQSLAQTIETGGGSVIAGGASVGADLVGRDKITGESVVIQNYYAGSPTESPKPTPLPDVPCPYRSLEFFDTQHAANYFGRQEMTAKLVAKVQECNFIAVVGPSGSGKSSLVRAGLMVALQKGAIQGSGNWKLEIFRPGENPLQSLAGALLKLNPALSDVDRWTDIEKLGKRLGNGELSIGLVLDQLRGSIPKLLLIVDQFEETFTLCNDDSLRNAFLDTLLAATDPKTGKPWLTVIFTLRADFFGRVLEREALSKRVDEGLVNVLPMTHEERRAAIEQPALQAGRSFESGLVERILDAVEAEPGQLPLLEFALTELWARQSAAGTLTHAAYEEIGEVSGAIAKRADETLRKLPKTDQERVRTIFTRLVRVAPPDEGSDDTKRRLLLNELDPSLRPLVQSLADARLLVTGGDEQNKSETAEIAHEALIRKWGTLQTWLNSDREFLLWRQRLRGLVENWTTARKDEGSLLRGATLGEAEGFLAARANEISPSEREFIEKSHQLAEQEAQAQEAAAYQLRRRNQFLTVALGIALIALLIAGYFWDNASRQQMIAEDEVIVRRAAEALAVTREAQANSAAQAEAKQRATAEAARSEAIAEKERADQNAADAEKAKRRAQAGEMAARVQVNIAQMNGVDDATILLAREAMLTTLALSLTIPVNIDTALRDVVDNASWRMTLPAAAQRHQGPVNQAAFSPDNKWIVSASTDNTVRIWEATTLEAVRMFVGHTDSVTSAAFSPNGKTIVSASWDKTLKVWDVASGKELRTLAGHTDSVTSAAFSPDGKTIVSASEDTTLKLWDAATGKEVRTLAGHTNYVTLAAFSPDGKTIVSASIDTTLKVWNVATGKEVRTLAGHTNYVTSAAFSPDGKTIVSASYDKTLKLWDADTGQELRTLQGHTDAVNAAAFSPDGKTIVSASGTLFENGDNTLKLWDVATGQELRTLSAHTSYVNAAAFSPDGKTIVSASYDNTLKLWDADTGQELRTFSGHTDAVTAAALSPDGKTIVSASADKTLKLWDVATGTELRTLSGHTGAVNAAAFSPDGKTIVSASADKTLKLWDAATGTELRTLSGHTDAVNAAAFSPDGKTIVSASGTLFENRDNTLKLWDADTGQELRTLNGHTDRVTAVAFSPDGKTIVSASSDNTLKLWDVDTGQELRTLNGHTDRITAAAFSPDGKTIVSASADKTLKLWDATTGQEVRTLNGHTDAVNAAAFSPDGKTIVSASGYPVLGRDNTLKLWDAATGTELRTLNGHTDAVNAAAFSPDGKTIVSASWDNMLKLWDADTGQELRTLSGHTFIVNAAAFSPDGKTIVSASVTLFENGDNSLKLWDVATGQEVRALQGHTDRVTAAAFSPDGKTIVSASDDTTLKLWDAATGTELRTLSGHTDAVNAAAFSPDGKTIVSASGYPVLGRDNTIKLWDADTGQELRTLKGHTFIVNAASFSPDGVTIVSASWDNTIKLWDAVTGQQMRTLQGHTSGVTAAAFSPDGKTIVSASADKTLKLWDVATGAELRTLSGHTSGVTAAAFSPDGKTIISASADGTVRIWVVSIEDLLQMAEARVQRPAHLLTDDERWQYGLQ